MSVSEAFRGVVDESVASMELAPVINGFHLEPRCRICRNDSLRTKVNDLLATGPATPWSCAPSATTTPSANSVIGDSASISPFLQLHRRRACIRLPRAARQGDRIRESPHGQTTFRR